MFWFFGHKACDILAPRPRIQPTPSALESQVSTYWTAWDVPMFLFLFGHYYNATSSSTLEGKLYEGPVTDSVFTLHPLNCTWHLGDAHYLFLNSWIGKWIYPID